MKKTYLFFCSIFFFNLSFGQNQAPKKFKLPLQLEEVSGLYLENSNSFWWLNDGGNSPLLYNTNAKGKLLDSITFDSVKNIDWEDLSHDDKGNIYIGDFGNNANKRKDLKIHIYNPEDQSFKSIQFKYPDQKEFPPAKAFRNFDMEAFFWHNDTLHLFSKNRIGDGNNYTKHYLLSDQAGTQTAVLRDSFYLKKRVVTSAAISPDGKTIALIAYTYKKVFNFFPSSAASIFFIKDFPYNDFSKGNIYKKGVPPYVIATQYESIDFLDEETIYVASEKTAFIKPKAKRFRIKNRNLKKRKLISIKK